MEHPLHLRLPQLETINPETLEFGVIGGDELDLEYSLYTISLWESKWKKPFIDGSKKLTREEEIGLFEAMCITPNVKKSLWSLLTISLKKDIYDYMSDSMSATTINRINNRPGKKEVITTEVVYYWMTTLNIPLTCERWHLNRLLKLIEVGFIKQTPSKKMGKKDAARMYRDLNNARLAKYNTRG